MATHQTAADYYKSLSSEPTFAGIFSDIDDAHNFRQCQQKLLTSTTRNFVLDFGDQDAWCGFDLEKDEFVSLMKDPVRPRRKCGRHRLTSKLETKVFWDEMDVSMMVTKCFQRDADFLKSSMGSRNTERIRQRASHKFPFTFMKLTESGRLLQISTGYPTA